jgi:glycine cleavage system aminomethyltransferase T
MIRYPSDIHVHIGGEEIAPGFIVKGRPHLVGERGFEAILTAKQARALARATSVTGEPPYTFDTRTPLERTCDDLAAAGAELADVFRAWHTAWTEPT